MPREIDEQDKFNKNPWQNWSGPRGPKVQKVKVVKGMHSGPGSPGAPPNTRRNRRSRVSVYPPVKHTAVPAGRSKTIVLHLVQSMRHFKNHACFRDDASVENHYILPHCNSCISGITSGSDLIKSKNKTYARVTAKGYLMEPQKYVTVTNKIKPDFVFCTTVPPLEHRGAVFRRPVWYNHHGFITMDGVNKCCGKKAPYRRTMDNNWQGFDRYIGIGQNWARLVKEGVKQPKKLKTWGLTQLDFLLGLDLDDAKHKIMSHYKTGGPCILFAGFQGYGKEYSAILEALVKYAKSRGVRIFVKPRGQMKEQIRALAIRINRRELKAATDLQNESCVNMLPTGVPIYYFLFADAVIVQHSGSLVMEAMMKGANVLEVQPHKRNDFLRLTKFPAIPRAKTIDQMIKWLDMVLSPGYQRGKEEEDQRAKFISYHTQCGMPQPDTWKKILKAMVNAK